MVKTKFNLNFDLETLTKNVFDKFIKNTGHAKLLEYNVETVKLFYIYYVLSLNEIDERCLFYDNSFDVAYYEALFNTIKATENNFIIEKPLKFNLKVSQNCKKGKGENCSDCGCFTKPCKNNFPTECDCLNKSEDFTKKGCIKLYFKNHSYGVTGHIPKIDNPWYEKIEDGLFQKVCEKHKGLKFFVLMYPFLLSIDNGEKVEVDDPNVQNYLGLLVNCEIIDDEQKETILNNWEEYANKFFSGDEGRCINILGIFYRNLSL
ncbi:MAG: hypothetical protein FWH05_03865 [Oscillospiraceae bacterium]|nr:hypothetical protein [Oscillospiraceae bacterium]